MVITFISDLHTKYNQITNFLPGGDLLICSGDMTGAGYNQEIIEFCKWFDNLKGYDKKVFIAGNHDFGFEKRPDEIRDILTGYRTIVYLQDESWGLYDMDTDKCTNIYGTPWQPEFCNWAFNLPKNGHELKSVWSKIPDDTHILITHGPPYGILDTVKGRYENLGCQLLMDRIKVVKPKIHVFGHIHSSYGYKFDGTTHFVNASVLNEQYNFANKPITIDWDKETNLVKFL